MKKPVQCSVLFRCFSIITVLALAAGSVVAQTTYYVDGSVGASGDGSVGSPWKTIGEAMLSGSPVTGGDTIQVASGTYQESIAGTFRGGSVGNPINLMADGAVTVTPGASGATRVFYPTGNNAAENHWKISGFNFTYHTTQGEGYVVDARYLGAANWTLENNTFEGLQRVWGLGNMNASGNVLRDNTFNLITTPIENSLGSDAAVEGNTFLQSGQLILALNQGGAPNVSGITVTHNVFYEHTGLALYVEATTGVNTISDVEISNNTFYLSAAALESMRFRYGDANSFSNVLAVNNLFVNAGIAHRNMNADVTLDASHEYLFGVTTAYNGNWNTGNDVVGQDPLFISTTPGEDGFMRFLPDSPAASGGNAAYADYFGAYAAIPEPGTLVLLLLGGAVAWIHRMRRTLS